MGDFQQLSSVKDQDIQKPQSSDEIQKIIEEAEEEANEQDEEQDGKKNDQIDDNLLEALHEMGGVKVNIEQNPVKSCYNVLKNAQTQKKKEELKVKLRHSLNR